MNQEQIKEKINQYKWEKWLERDFGPFIVSVFTQPEGMKNIGIDIEMPSFVSQGGFWYLSHEVMKKSAEDCERWMEKNNKTVFDITNGCKIFYLKSKKRIKEMVKSERAGKEEMSELLEIFRKSTNYIWITHSLEEMYMDKLEKEVHKYWEGDTHLFIGDISFPKKKNAYIVFQEKLRKGANLEKLAKEYGWLNIRNGFGDPFTVDELRALKEKLKSEKVTKHKKVKVPTQIKRLVEQVRELVFFRTYRTDVFFELLYLARPIIKKYGESLGIDFKEMRNYRMDDLAKGIVKVYPKWITGIQYKNDYAIFTEDAIRVDEKSVSEIKGNIAFMGLAKGLARIVKSVSDLPNVKDGDVLVTNMTTPNYLIAMKRAVAFITDEGGITCHAAIVAREMQKPCIIGTKIASTTIKDGDMVEVDANKGIVKIIK